MNRLFITVIVWASACGARQSPQERTLTRLFHDARGDEATFVAHFAPSMSRDEVLRLRASLAKEAEPRFEQGTACLRAYWGDFFIDHSYYFYLRATPQGFLVTDVEYDHTDAGLAFARIGAMEHGARDSGPSEYDKCKAANAATTP